MKRNTLLYYIFAVVTLASCQSTSVQADRATELQRIEVLSQLLPSRKPASARYKPGFELRIASPLSSATSTRLDIGTHSYFVDNEPFLAPQDILTLSLREQSWSKLSPYTRKRFEAASGIIDTQRTFYSVEMHLTTLGAKLYQDAQQKSPDGVLVLRDDDKKLRLFGFIDPSNEDHRPVLYFISEKTSPEATQTLDTIRSALEHSFDF